MGILVNDGPGSDVVNGSDGNIFILNKDDTLHGNDGNDTIFGGSGNDLITGDGGSDSIDGGSGNDTISGGFSADSVNGGDGNDLIIFGAGEFFDSVDGGAGNDTLDASAATNAGVFDFAAGTITGFGGGTLANVETFLGSNTVGDTIISDGSGSFFGQGGNDTMTAGLGVFETLDGGTGTDTLITTPFSGNYVVNLATGLTNFIGESFVNFENITSGAGSDSLTGTAGANLINGGDGNDTLNGAGGADSQNGGNGDDLIFASLGTDTADGGAGTDTLNTTSFSGNYVVNLATGLTNFIGESFVNFENITSGAGSDSLTGTAGANLINGGDGNDTLNGAGGADSQNGGNGDDLIFASLGTDTADGGAGTDTLNTTSFSGNYVVNLATGLTNFIGESFVNFENITSGAGSDSLTGTAGANLINGGDGNDTLNGAGGADSQNGGNGDDLIFASLGTDTADGGAGTDTLNTTSFSGNYVVNLATGLTNFIGESFVNFENITSGAGSDSLTGTAGANLINGGDGNDTLNGAGGADSQNGGNGDDLIFASLGTDTADGGAGIDTLNTTSFSGNYVVNLATGLTNFIGESFVNFENITSGSGSDTLTGTTGSNVIDGGAGNDSILGDSGTDTLIGGTGNDTLVGGLAADSVSGGDGNDLIVFGAGEFFDSVDGGAGNDTIDASAATNAGVFDFAAGTITGFGGGTLANVETFLGSNTVGDTIISDGSGSFFGQGGNDTMTAGLGTAETLDGGAGVDTLITTPFTGNYNVNLATGLTNFAGESFVNFENLTSGIGNDTLTGSTAKNTINGGDGNDLISGGGAKDNLNGGLGDDSLFGGTGTDRLNGGGGVDSLQGDAGNDTMTGGGGNDSFVFTANFGNDVITDFNGGPGAGDVLDFTALGISLSNLTLSSASGGLDTLITVTGFAESILLQGVAFGTLVNNDFIF